MSPKKPIKQIWEPILNEEKVDIWDFNALPESCEQNVLLLRSCAHLDRSDWLSVPVLIEENAVKYRQRYLDFIYKTKISFKSMRGYDLLCGSLIQQKSAYIETSMVEEAIKVLAITDCLDEFNGRQIRVRVFTNNKALADSIGLWCKGNDNTVERIEVGTSDNTEVGLKRKVYGLLPTEAKGIVWLTKFIVEHWNLWGVGIDTWKASRARTLFVSYLFNISRKNIAQGQFKSSYWGDLSKLLIKSNHKTNWLHIYIKDCFHPNAKSVAESIKALNRNKKSGQVHVMVESFLSIVVIVTTLVDWNRLRKFGNKYRSTMSKEGGKDSIIWPLLKSDWESSTRGEYAMSTALYANLIDSAIKSLPTQKTAVYLQENIGWEFSFIQAWRAHAHGKIIGWPHGAIRFWDLRYFFERGEFSDQTVYARPRPDFVATSGRLDKLQLINSGYPEEELVEVEALRFMYLNAYRKKIDEGDSTLNNKGINLLVIGDYSKTSTRFLLELLNTASRKLPKKINVTIKFHPSCIIEHNEYPNILFEVTASPISELLSSHTIAVTGNLTSAGIEAYCAGLHLITCLNIKGLNKSPLRDIKDVTFVSSAEELFSTIQAIVNDNVVRENRDVDNIFCVDPRLTGWKALILNQTEDLHRT